MSDNQNSNRPVYPKSILDHRTMRLSTEAADQGKWATLSWDVNDVSEVLFRVWPSDSDDAARNRGPIEAKIPLSWFNTFCGMVRVGIQMSKEGKDWKDKVDSLDRPWVRGADGRNERSKDFKSMGGVWVGCTDGKVWISVNVYKRPNIQFFFGKTIYNNLYHGDGQPYSDAEISRAFASGLITSLEQTVPHIARERYNHEKTLPKKPGDNQGGNRGGQGGGNGNGGGNNYGNRGGNGGGGQSQRTESTSSAAASTDFDELDDDMPF